MSFVGGVVGVRAFVAVFQKVQEAWKSVRVFSCFCFESFISVSKDWVRAVKTSGRKFSSGVGGGKISPVH